MKKDIKKILSLLADSELVPGGFCEFVLIMELLQILKEDYIYHRHR